MDMRVDLLLDILLAGLLLATLVYCFVLNRRLSRLRNAKGDMAEMVRSFHQATEAARGSVAELKQASDAIGRDLQEQLSRSREMLEELDLVTSSASRVADRIEKGVEHARPVQDQRSAAAPETQTEGRSHAERDLLQALRKVR
ncbi:DUF6468 domain-containing protein [Minwuia sp.]|uniref:DUF6468 domain-containing protein n=1 Tax=Minwuia sp. TaxID=2493630 RepID=UPI003A8E2C83